MNAGNTKVLLAIGWVAVVLFVALLVPVDSLRGWLLTTFLAFAPAVAMLHFAREQRQTMSESIHHARR
jgi:hypothetical protein